MIWVAKTTVNATLCDSMTRPYMQLWNSIHSHAAGLTRMIKLSPQLLHERLHIKKPSVSGIAHTIIWKIAPPVFTHGDTCQCRYHSNSEYNKCYQPGRVSPSIFVHQIHIWRSLLHQVQLQKATSYFEGVEPQTIDDSHIEFPIWICSSNSGGLQKASHPQDWIGIEHELRFYSSSPIFETLFFDEISHDCSRSHAQAYVIAYFSWKISKRKLNAEKKKERRENGRKRHESN